MESRNAMTKMNESKNIEIDLEKHWKGVVRFVSYQMVFHTAGSDDVPNSIRGITTATSFRISVEDVIKCLNFALSTPDDLGKTVHSVESMDSSIREHLRNLIILLEKSGRN